MLSVMNTEDKQYNFDSEINQTGYTDIHYWISPQPIDSCYELTQVPIYNKFELQIRTVTQHSWSEMQHRKVYKNVDSEKQQTDLNRFESLVNVVNEFDAKLNNIIHDQKLSTPSKNIDISDSDELMIRITSLIHDFDNTKMEDYDKANKTRLIKNEIKSHIQTIKTKSFEYKLQICVLFLKGSLLNTFSEHFQELILKGGYTCATPNYEWALLRQSEFYQRNGNKDLTISALQELEQCIKNKSITNIDNDLLRGLAVIYWWCNLFNNAITITEYLLQNKSSNIANQKIIRLRLLTNLLYYKCETLKDAKLGDKDVVFKAVINLEEQALNIT